MDLDLDFSKLPWLGRNNMATTLKGLTLLMLLEKRNDSLL
jgi:hypothetical protein